MTDTLRTCKTCGRALPLEQFAEFQNGLDARYRRHECRACYATKMREYFREYWRAHPRSKKDKRAYYARVLAGLNIERERE